MKSQNSKQVVREMVEEFLDEAGIRKPKYSDPVHRRLATALHHILSPQTHTGRDYKIDTTDEEYYVYLFYVSVLKQDGKESGNKGGGTLKRLVNFSEKTGAAIRIFIDQSKICVEIKVRRPQGI